MSDSSSITSLPTESELDLELAELVNWQRFATIYQILPEEILNKLNKIIMMFNDRNLGFMEHGYEDAPMLHGMILY